MAPKKKVKTGKGTKGSGGIIDGVSISEMSREQLEPFVLRIQQQLEREREERNFFQLERDKIRTFWEITRQQLEEYRALLRNKDKELEEVIEKHQQEVKVYQQKIKHLTYEQHTEISEMKAENMVNLKICEEEFAKQELALINDKTDLKRYINKQEEDHLNQLRIQLMEKNTKISKIRSNYENTCRALEYKHQTLIEQTREELNLKNEMEIYEVEERKNRHIDDLIQNHNKNYFEIINFYTEVTANNLALINVLKEKLIAMKENKEKSDKLIQDAVKENEKLIEPLKFAQETVTKLQKKVSSNIRDERRLKVIQKQYKELKLKYENMKYLYEDLSLQKEKLQKEKEYSIVKSTADFMAVQEKLTYQNAAMERKIKELSAIIEIKETQIIDLMTQDENPRSGLQINKIQNILEQKNMEIDLLTEKLSNMNADNIQEYNCKLKITNSGENPMFEKRSMSEFY